MCVSWPCLLLHGLLGPLQGFPVWQEGQRVIWRDHHFKYRGLWPWRHTFARYLIRSTLTPQKEIPLGKWLVLYSAVMLSPRSCLEDTTWLPFCLLATRVNPPASL